VLSIVGLDARPAVETYVVDVAAEFAMVDDYGFGLADALVVGHDFASAFVAFVDLARPVTFCGVGLPRFSAAFACSSPSCASASSRGTSRGLE
jgi:hypothetical protein